MKRIPLLLLLLIAFYPFVKADIVSKEIASRAAKNHYFNYSTKKDYSSISLTLAYSKIIDDQAVYYIFNVNNSNGFVIISAEDNVYPVLGYSFKGSYDHQPSFDAANFNYWMDNYAEQIIYARENLLEADAFISTAWKSLLENAPLGKDFDNVDPLLTTLWDQGTYYNQLCPSDGGGPGGHVWAGCVATAMGQVMKYHDFPPQGTGSHSYNCAGYGNQSANFGATTYNWSSMPNQLYSNNISVATLLYHLGVSVDMQYSASGSGAYSSDARDALVTYFGYSSNAQLLTKGSFPIETFENKLRNELNLNRPVYYSGSGNGGGHAFVCDGYQGTNYFHFNWGWSGYANGYFYLNNLNPGGYQFNQNQSAMFYVYPEGTATLAGPENFAAEVVGEDVYLSWDTPSNKVLLGYNIYRNNVLIEYTANTEFTDANPDQGSYSYYVCAVYDEGESFPSELISVFIGGGNTTIISDDIEAYNSGERIACQNPTDWTTWSNSPCSGEDAYVSSVLVNSGSNSVVVESGNDLVMLINNFTSGLYKISFYMNVPTGYLGYFNTLQLFNGANSEWGMQVFFDENGQGRIDGGGEGAASFTFPYNAWMYNEVIIDMDNDWAEYKLDGYSIHGWQWSVGAFGQSNLNQLGGVNFYAWDASKDKGTPKYYFDDFIIEEFGGVQLMPPLNFTLNMAFENIQLTWDAPTGKDLTGYNIYYSYNEGDFNLLANTNETSYIVESPGSGLHSYYITAVYDEGESDPTNTLEILLTGTDEFEKVHLCVFPNPASDYVLFESDEAITSIFVYSLTGQVMINKATNNKSYKLDISKLNAGTYFLIVKTENESVSRQIVKE
jgi:hypothetical protein